MEASDSSTPREGVASERTPTIWAVGGGKGGVGKSLLCSSLAIASARAGHRTALVDLDLGAANAHSLLGMRPPPRSLSDFVERRVDTLAETLCETPIDGLSIVGGARASLDLANPKYSQKERLIRQLRTLEVDHVFLDLSAGCAYNVLDFFLAAQQRIAVLVPEATAIENTQHFLKTAFFRSLRHVARREPTRSAIQLALERSDRSLGSARDLVDAVRQIDAEAGAKLAAQAARFAPMLIVNQISPHAPPDAAAQIALACRHYLAAGVRERGRLPRDERVRDALVKGVHVLDACPASPFSIAVQALSASLLAGAPAERVATVPRRDDLCLRRATLPTFEGFRPGAYLRRCRERAGLSLEEIHRQTRIHCLESLEAERFETMPSETYVAAFVRSYARTLGVPEIDRVVARYVDAYRAAAAAR